MSRTDDEIRADLDHCGLVALERLIDDVEPLMDERDDARVERDAALAEATRLRSALTAARAKLSSEFTATVPLRVRAAADMLDWALAAAPLEGERP